MRSVTSSSVYPRLIRHSYARSALSRSLNIPVINRESSMAFLLCWFLSGQNLLAREVPSKRDASGDAVAVDRVLVPLKADARTRRGLDHPIHGSEWFGEDRCRHVEVFDVVAGRRRREQVSADFDEEVARARHAG